MESPDPRDEALLAAIESEKLDGPLADDPEVIELFAAYQKLESLFAMLRQAEGPFGEAEKCDSFYSRSHRTKQRRLGTTHFSPRGE